ncbi:Flp pilus assembly protein CpaB [Brevundimonas sp. 3P9-tot-E]|uniref:Flp pilus assembly protein CpaB n=1 Tax=Brevundimonas TaxID=41275 RepID=UPI001906B4FB|nr:MULTISPECIES: Flp pilus assembly protein CpaB [Brevundimonas]MDA0743557.1 Flp pilus assembly protein CpaB [Pseudomonadota bacterium]MBK1970555.1 Flp pilus assembly protein CpaB [Brevundimonas diminuta]MBK1976764.1 Flp pilus assembly protein CpaB [Brevundimonas diminuta]MDA1322666.1 Flp pilus assembly protein CpaB [Pseudomonadota bacterium]MDM8352743.1 Flp pilus assembly protein CpaB [Brevundimonas diminuta]
MKPAKIAVICIAALAAVGLALVVRAMGSPGREPAASVAAAVEARPMAKVLVAARDLEPGRRLADADLSWKDWPVEELNPLFITDGSTPLPAKPEGAAAENAAVDGTAKDKPTRDEARAQAVDRAMKAAAELNGPGAKADYIGAVVREPILAGEPIVARKIVRAGDSGYMAAYLEPGTRAMAIRVTVETAAGGFILPGDRVDVLMTREIKNNDSGAGPRFTTATIMRNMKVLAIDQSTRAAEDEQAVVGATATLAVSERDAELLALARSEGDLSLVLRSYADTAGPSGHVPGAVRRGGERQGSVVKVYRGGGAPQDVATP